MAVTRIVVAEDDASIRELLVHHLERDGFHCDQAADGPAALRLARTGADVLILDLGLPVVDGFDVVRALRREGRELPILVLTARSDEIDRVVGLEIGADDYVVKPFSPREVVARVKALGRRAGLTSAQAPVVLTVRAARDRRGGARGAHRRRGRRAQAARVRALARARVERGRRAVARDAARTRVGIRVRRRPRARSTCTCGGCGLKSKTARISSRCCTRCTASGTSLHAAELRGLLPRLDAFERRLDATRARTAPGPGGAPARARARRVAARPPSGARARTVSDGGFFHGRLPRAPHGRSGGARRR